MLSKILESENLGGFGELQEKAKHRYGIFREFTAFRNIPSCTYSHRMRSSKRLFVAFAGSFT